MNGFCGPGTNSNIVCLHSAERLGHIRSLLKAAGNNKAEGDAVLQELKARNFRGASNETHLKSADPINKRLQILDKATAADVLGVLTDLQFDAGGQLTCVARWSIAHKLVTATRTPGELKWMVLRIAGAIAASDAANPSQKLIQEMFEKTKERDTTLFDTLVYEHRFVSSVCSQINLPEGHPSKRNLETFLSSLPDYNNYRAWRGQDMRYQHGGFNMPALNDILTLIEKVADGYMLKVFKASVVNFPT